MEDANVMLNNIISIHNRYSTLQGLFNEFCAQILNTVERDERLTILNINQSDNTLTIEFLDRKIQADFLSFVDDNGGQKGHIKCNLICPTENNEPKLIENISFNGQGATNIATNNDNDPYMINDHTDAIAILFNWVTISTKENF